MSSEWNTERVREDASGDSEDDELPCVIGESAGDCVWRGPRRSAGSPFHRQGAAYWKEWFVIFFTWTTAKLPYPWLSAVVLTTLMEVCYWQTDGQQTKISCEWEYCRECWQLLTVALYRLQTTNTQLHRHSLCLIHSRIIQLVI